ncbi:MAG: hypothetical protein LBS20_11845 [Prevotella sp.]|jgi:hypothetical protein|nr:hypothetical protein [Prevotella sp.]
MELKEFIRKVTRLAKDSNIHIMVFASDGKGAIFAIRGNHDIAVRSAVTSMADYPFVLDTIKTAVDIIDKRKVKVTVINTEDEANDYLIDQYPKNKDLNDSNEGL